MNKMASDVAVIIPKFLLTPGRSIWYRSFLIVGRRDKVIQQAKSLVGMVDYGLVTFDPKNTPTVPVVIENGRAPTFQLYAQPVDGTMPLFLIKNTTTGHYAVTTDPYIFIPKEKVDLELDKYLNV